MLDHLRQKAAQTFAAARSVTLSSYGPAGIQSSRVPCAAQGLSLYLLLPHSSNHLLNLEQSPGILATTDDWDLRGNARLLSREEIPAGIQPPGTEVEPDQTALTQYSTWGWVVIEIRPTRLTLHAPKGLGNIETIDF